MKPSRVSFLAGLLFTGCSDYNVGNGNDVDGGGVADIAVEPVALDFGSRGEGLELLRSVRILNLGSAPLDVTEITLGPSPAFSLPEPVVAFTIPAGGSQTQEIVWTPTDDADASWLQISSNDRDTPSLQVPLTGEGLFGALTITPDPLLFELISVGCSLTAPVAMWNSGMGPLTVTGASSTGSAYTLANLPAWPVVLEPGASVALDVIYAPLYGSNEMSGTLVVESTDRRGDISSALEGQSVGRPHHEEVFEQADGSIIDLMFFVDTSGSMSADKANLAANFTAFLDALVGGGIDYQVMVVTADDGCHNQTIITPTTPSPDEVFSAAVNGAGGSLYESGLTVTLAAISQTEPGECNEGFLRPGVPVLAVALSDEPEQSPDPWDFLVEVMRTFSPSIIINAIVGQPGNSCGAQDGVGYHEAAMATGGVDLDICDLDWGAYVADILGTAGPQSAFPLSAPADPATIVVEIDGIVTTEWFWDEPTNSVAFDPDEVPPGGTTVEIAYDEPVECP